MLDRRLTPAAKSRLRRARHLVRSVIRPPPPDEKVEITVQSVYEGHFRITYRGIPTPRCPFDYCMYQMIVSEVRPDLIIEIGTFRGGSALYLADLMNAVGHGFIHTIDVEDHADPLVTRHHRIKRYLGGWAGYSLDEAAAFKRVLVIEDGSHMYADTIGAIEKFAPLVSVGSYLLVEDGIVSTVGTARTYDGGPLRAIREFLVAHPHFRVDRTFCDMFGRNATFNVNGYLKRLS